MLLFRILLSVLFLFLNLQLPGASADEAAVADFAPASPASQGVDESALLELTGAVEEFIADGSIVGAELLVVKNRRTILHRVFGAADRDDEIPMTRNTIFNIRSMTKPITGTAALMLADDGLLGLDDLAADYIDSFDHGASRRITVDHLLTHRSGLPMSVITSFDQLDSLLGLARLCGEAELRFDPGAQFHYSDAGSDTLGAIVELAAEEPLHEFHAMRILGPLGLRDTRMLVEKGDPITARFSSAYFGGADAWTRYWRRGGDALYPCALGSQSAFSTTHDYARFLAFWMDGGQVDGEALLSPEAVERALSPLSPMTYPSGFHDVEVWYGRMWTLWLTPGDEPVEQRMLAFGHGGSDGTWAWAFPRHDLIVCYFTQSRGQATGIGLERDLDRLLLRPDEFPTEPRAVIDLEPFLGIFVDGSARFTILERNGVLALRLPQQLETRLAGPDESGIWVSELDARMKVSFVRDDSGAVTAMLFDQDGQVIELPRGEKQVEPSFDRAAVRDFLGTYHDPQADAEVKVLIRNDHLAVLTEALPEPLELITAGADGKWRMRINPSAWITFERDAAGAVTAYTAHVPGRGSFVRPRIGP